MIKRRQGESKEGRKARGETWTAACLRRERMCAQKTIQRTCIRKTDWLKEPMQREERRRPFITTKKNAGLHQSQGQMEGVSFFSKDKRDPEK